MQQSAIEKELFEEVTATSTEDEVEVVPFVEEVQIIEGVASTTEEVAATSALVAAKQYWQHGCEVPSLRHYL